MGVCADRKEEEEDVVGGGGPLIDRLFLLRMTIEDIGPGEPRAFDERVVILASRSFLLPVKGGASLSLPWVGDEDQE